MHRDIFASGLLYTKTNKTKVKPNIEWKGYWVHVFLVYEMDVVYCVCRVGIQMEMWIVWCSSHTNSNV